MPQFLKPTLTTAPVTRLAAGQTRVINASEGTTLTVCQGRLWVTEPGCAEDFFVHAGQQLHLRHNGTLVQADGPLGETSYLLQPDAVAPTSWGRYAWLAPLVALAGSHRASSPR